MLSKRCDKEPLAYDKLKMLYKLVLTKNDKKSDFLVTPALSKARYKRAMKKYKTELARYEQRQKDEAKSQEMYKREEDRRKKRTAFCPNHAN